MDLAVCQKEACLGFYHFGLKRLIVFRAALWCIFPSKATGMGTCKPAATDYNDPDLGHG